MAKTLAERFWQKVGDPDPVTGCLPWMASRDSRGYGHIKYEGRLHRAHRVAWFLAYDEWPSGVIDHVKSRGCRHKHCVNVAHLEDVPHAENVRRGDSGKHWRDRTHCPQGHEYTPANTYVRPRGQRACRTCNRDRNRAYARKRRQEARTARSLVPADQ